MATFSKILLIFKRFNINEIVYPDALRPTYLSKKSPKCPK